MKMTESQKVAAAAWRIRRYALQMGEVQGQGYIGQALGYADVLATAFSHAMTYRPEDPEWEGRDRFLLSHGHYAIAYYAALLEAGIIPEAELETYGSDDSRLPMSGMATYTPGMEMSGGSLGQGLSIAVGMALGLRQKQSKAWVYNSMSDGELDEGSTWEAAMSAAHYGLSNLINLVDVNKQLLMAAAGGMAKEGFIPFATTYAAFATRRAYDFIHQVIAEEHLNVKICAALPGLTTGYGPSHQATEDLAIMRGIPGMVIVDPCDALEIEQAVPAIADHQGPVYMRLLRGKVPLVLDKYDYQFELGKAKLLEDGNDVLIISSGLMTMRALEAAEKLRADNIGVAVLHVPTIKPLDEKAIIEQASKPGRLVVTAENHTAVGGLGEAVAALLMRKGVRCELDSVGLPDAFLLAGALPTLHDRYGISTAKIVEKIKYRLR